MLQRKTTWVDLRNTKLWVKPLLLSLNYLIKCRWSNSCQKNQRQNKPTFIHTTFLKIKSKGGPYFCLTDEQASRYKLYGYLTFAYIREQTNCKSSSNINWSALRYNVWQFHYVSYSWICMPISRLVGWQPLSELKDRLAF